MNFLALFGNIWFRRAAIVLVVALALWGIYRRGVSEGKVIGQQNQAQENANQGANQVKQERAVTVTELTQLTQQVVILQQQVDTTQKMILNTLQARQDAHREVAGLSEAQVLTLINQALGKPSTATDFTADDRRRIADCFTQLPLCNKENEQYQTQIKTLEAKEVLSDKKFDVLSGYALNLEQHYTELWNEKSLPKRKWYCAWLCRRKPHIDQPNPADLKPKG